jgi:hypothetical protein
MVMCLALITVVVVLETWPVSRLFWEQLRGGGPVSGTERVGIGVAFAAVVVVTGTTWALARRMGLRHLARLQV